MTPQIKRAFEKSFRKLAMIFSSAVALKGQRDTAKIQFSEDEVRENVPVYHPYGFHSVLPKSASILVGSNGDRNSSFVIAATSEKIKRQASTEEGVVQLLDGEGACVTLRNGKIHISCSSFVLRKGADDLVTLNKELISLLKDLMSPGALSVNPQTMQVWKLEPFMIRLAALEKKWG